ncbi:hypothetical protein ERN12_00060 [Rhodobacteraceae bacterium]|nr:hypothetical protein ERN12_00060 [Paracoccaceae bacterium]
MLRSIDCNIQTAVDANRNLIVAHEIAMRGAERHALSMMVAAANDLLAADQPTEITDQVDDKSSKSSPAKRPASQVWFPTL